MEIDSPVLQLFEGAKTGNAIIIALLIEQGIDVNASDDLKRTALHLAAAHGHIDVFQLLLSHNASVHVVDERGNTPLHLASINGHTSIVQLILQREPDLALHQDVTGKTALAWAHDRLRRFNPATSSLSLSLGDIRQQLQQIVQVLSEALQRQQPSEAKAEAERQLQGIATSVMAIESPTDVEAIEQMLSKLAL